MTAGAHTVFVALIRGINVGGRNRVSMEELREHAPAHGLQGVRTYIQSGNLVGRSPASPAEIAGAVEGLLRDAFDVDVPVVVRSAEDWATIVSNDPDPDRSAADPKRVMLGLARDPLSADVVETLRGRAAGGEIVERVGEALWLHFPEGVGASKLTPAVLDRAGGSPVTLRNAQTVHAISALVDELA